MSVQEAQELPFDPNISLLPFEAAVCAVLVVLGLVCLAFDQWRAKQ